VLVCGGLAYYVISSIRQGAQQVGENFSRAVEQQREQAERARQQMQQRIEEERQKAQERLEKDEQERKQQQARALQERNEKIAEKRKATQVANAFMREAKAGRVADAYAMTSTAYRKRVSQEKFAELTREYVNTLQALNTFRETVNVDQDLIPPFTYSQTQAARGRFIKVEVTVVKEGADWKVDQFEIGTRDPFRK
jgi:DNA repair exonuclease SbcCD ATPase subunit